MVVFPACVTCLRSALRCGDPESYCTAAWIVFVWICQYWRIFCHECGQELLRVSVEAVAGPALNVCCAYLSAERQNDAGTGTAYPGCLRPLTNPCKVTHTMYDVLLIHMCSNHVHV